MIYGQDEKTTFEIIHTLPFLYQGWEPKNIDYKTGLAASWNGRITRYGISKYTV